ncbi:MAG: PAS domain S-box protein, partial [Oceanospirillaceae bacterium]|nr:PAS domain S-box protein [Oceanospirillaceae bacterium]
VRLTGPITLVQATGKPQQSFLILMPIYRGGSTPSTLEERVEKGFGWSYAPLIMEEVLSGLNYDPEKLHYELYDVTDLDDPVLFYTAGTHEGSAYEQIETSVVYGRNWRASLSVSPTFIRDLHLPNPLIFLVFGLLISFLVAAIVAAIRVNMARRREVVEYQARITALVESSADGILSKNLDGIILSWNKGAESIFGFTQEDAIGQSITTLLVPEDLQKEAIDITFDVKKQKQARSIETRRKTKFGGEVPVALTLSPILDVVNDVIGVSISVRDISERKKAEEKIRELNANLEFQVKERTAELQELNLLLNEVLSASSEVSIIATDTQGIIKLFNTGAERMLGHSADEVVGKITPVGFHIESEIEQQRDDIREATGTHVIGDLDVLIYNALRGNYDPQEWTYINKQGNTRPVSLVITPMKDSKDEVVGFLGIAMDISEQKRSQRELIYTRDQLLLAAEVAKLGIWSWNIEDNTLEWSDLMFEIYHLPVKNDVEYMDWFNRVHPDDRTMVEKSLKEAVDSSSDFNFTFRIILPDNSIRYIVASGSLHKGPSGKMTKMTGINRDITQEHELESWLRKAKDEADAASAAKSNFLANMSHEIRTPMNAILGMLHLVKRTNLNHQQNDYISKAQISAKSLLSLINDILDFSKVDAGKLELEKAPFEVEELLCELSTVLSGSSIEKNVELIFDIDEKIPAYLVGDKLRLLQILINLVSNAVKFTLEGSVVLKIHSLAIESGMSRLSVSVNDTGIGIAQDQINSIFDVFSQAESSTARRFGGSGLGLVICRRFVELMGGELHVDSVLGEGSRFYFTVDLPIADSSVEKTANPLSREALRILIVDSNAVTQAILARMAEAQGWHCEKVESLEQAVQSIQQAAEQGVFYDVILLDAKTTDFMGQQSIEEIRNQVGSYKSEPKIIMLPNMLNNQFGDGDELESISGYLLKPITLRKLSESVSRSFLGAEGALGNSQSSHKNERGSLTGVNLLLVEDNVFNRQVATELLIAEGAEVSVAEDGIEGVATILNHDEGSFDLVLMDMQMPGMDGLEATKEIRKESRFDSLPIIAMTANVSEVDRQACLDAGMNDHIGKPLDIDQMVVCILKYTQKHDLVMESEKEKNFLPEEAKTESTEPEEYEEIESILGRFGGSVELYKSVVEGFTHEANELLSDIKSGIEEKNEVKTRESLHTLKGASLTMGLLKLSNRLFAYEKVLKTSEDSSEIDACLSSINTAQLHLELEEELATIFAKIQSHV